MATITSVVGSRTQLTSSSLASLLAGYYCASDALNLTTNDPLDVLLEVSLSTGTPSGNKQGVVFAVASLDGTNYSSGPTGSNSATNEPDLHFVGTVPMNDNGTHTKVFSLAGAFGGVLPPYVKIVVKNDSGATFDAGTIYYSEVTGNAS